MASFKESLEKDMKKKKTPPKKRFGFLGGGSKSYDEAQDALEQEENKDQYAQAEE